MKKFKFSLEKVLSLREFEQNQAQIELGKAQSVVNDLNNQIKFIALEIVKSNESRANSTDLNFLLSIENYVNGLNYKKEILLEELAKAQLVLEEKRAIVVEAIKKRKSLEKHHLFPKAYLKSMGYSDAKINQMANYAYIDWKDNMDILDDAPAVYYPIVCEGKSDDEIIKMELENALPHEWEHMEYEEFLVARRMLMSKKIKGAFELLKKNVTM